MSLDCNTANGRRYINYQHLCLQSFCTEKNVSFVPTVDTSEADVDAVLWRKHIVGVAEVKTRNMTFTELSRFGSYLITYAKLTKLCSVAKALHCPGLLIVYLIPDNRIIWWKICDKTGDFLFNPKIERTETQATCNGGTAIRYNAYLPLSLIQC